MRTSFTGSSAADRRQQRKLVAVGGGERSLVGEHGAVERELDLLALHRLAERTRQRGEQALPVERTGNVLVGRAREVGELAEEDEFDGHPPSPRHPREGGDPGRGSATPLWVPA